MPDKNDNLSPEERVSDFLRKFVNNKKEKETKKTLNTFTRSKQNTRGRSTNPFARHDINEYVQLELPEEVKSKITHLQQIASSIEDKVIKPKRLPSLKGKNFKIDYKKELNRGQFLATITVNGPILVIAGAGSGKTRTITYRVAYLLENQVPPEEILLLTFTRKAANEMVKRTSELLPEGNVDQVMRGTFHAFANYTLRRYANMVNIPINFTIVDTGDSEDIIDLIRSELKFNKAKKAFPRKNRIQGIISKSRNCSISIQEVVEREFTGLLDYVKDLELIARVYKEYKRANNVFDYDDLMEVLYESLRDFPVFREKMQERYRYIMVDEFQDTNIVQKGIVDFLAGKHHNIMVVGDDAQSIYAFRGANFENILTFPAVYPDCKIIKLEQNYRSNQDILNFTNNIANNALLGYKKTLFSENSNEFKPIAAKYYDIQEEADFIGDKILALREQGIDFEKIAVLYRSSFHSNSIQTALIARKIPYIVVGGIKFIERRHIKDMISYLRIILNPLDAVAWNRVLKLIPGVGKVTASKIIESIQANDGKLNVESFGKKKFGKGLADLQKALETASREDKPLIYRVEVLRDYYNPILKELETDYRKRAQDLDVLQQMSERYEVLDRFLSDFALDPPSDQFQDMTTPLIDETEENPMTLSTIHSAKGLEWHTVFVPHLLDGLFPSSRGLKKIEELEEERRLFYVACSRAKEQLYLSMPSYFSSWDDFYTKPSRFLIEVDPEKYRGSK